MSNIFSTINSLIGLPLGWVMWLLFQIVRSYGVALFLFTIFSRLVMIPTTINTQKTSAKMAILRPQQEEIQKKYANNQRKMQEELSELYAREKFSPTAGCLPMVLQFVILFGIIDVIYKPLTHILRFSTDVVTQLTEIATNIGVLEGNVTAPQLRILGSVFQNPGAYAGIDSSIIETMQNFIPNMNFLGIDLMRIPSMGDFNPFNMVILIPIMSGITSLLMSLHSIRNPATQGQPGAGSMKIMMLSMPIMSTMFTFSLPAGVGLYWSYANIVGFVQNIIMNKLYNPKEMAEKAKQEMEERRERERQDRIEAKKRAKESGDGDEAALSKKELSRRKLAEARKRDAEKYGEAYQESDDDELI